MRRESVETSSLKSVACARRQAQRTLGGQRHAALSSALRLLGLLTALGCEPRVPPPPTPLPVDPCEALPELRVAVVPPEVRVRGAATVSATGGSGRSLFSLQASATGGQLSGDRYVAGPTPGTDVVVALDTCGNTASATVKVRAAFSVAPAMARVKPGTTFTVEVAGLVGAARIFAQSLASGGSISLDGRYVAGPSAGLDLVQVSDEATGEQALLQYTVDPAAQLRAQPVRVGLPTRSVVPLTVLDGTGVVDWRVVSGSGGTLERVEDKTLFRAGLVDGLTTVLEGVDHFTSEKTTVTVRVLTELTRPDLRAQGRRSDTATLVTADFDGDGVADVALGLAESDLARPNGGAVFIYRGGASGLPAEATWIITGNSDTAQLGTVLAAGDLDGDGKADLAIAAPGDDVTVADSGAVYLYTFAADGPHLLRAPLTGLGRGSFGAALAIADVDGDTRNDLLVGSPGTDLAPGTGFTARGVIDVFLAVPGRPLPDLGTLRLSGFDLAVDGATRRFSNVRAGRALVGSDLNGDGRVDVAFLSTVNNTLLGGTPVARAVTAIQVHLGRAGPKPFADEPDLFVLPSNPADGDEGNWKLGVVPAAPGQLPLLMAVADRLDAPNLTSTGGNAGGVNAGGALLFDLSAAKPTSPGANPTQLGRTDSRVRLWGDQVSIQAGRSFALADVDADGAPELLLGAPYATAPGPPTVPNAGRLLVYKLAGLAAGAQVNKPDAMRSGTGRSDTLGTAVTVWRGHVVAFNSRATTPLGDFTGRLDVFSAGADPLGWTVTSAALPAKPGGQGFGASIEVGSLEGQLRALVGVASISGPGLDGLGNETNAGQALVYSLAQPTTPRVVLEGATTPYVRDGGWPAFGGRPVASDVTLTDFNGDGRADLVVMAPAFSTPTLLADGGVSSTDYAAVHAECLKNSTQTPGAALVHFGQPDGDWREAVRAWVPTSIAGCVVPDGGAASSCVRAGLGRNGAVGGFDFDGDGKQDLAVTRTNGLEVLPGSAPDDLLLTKPTMACGVLFSLPSLPWPTSAPASLGDLDGDGCDEVAVRYSDGANRQGLVIAFGFDVGGTRCLGHSAAAWVRVSGDTETGVPTMRLGVSATRAGQVLSDGRDYLAITADLYPWLGQTQPAVLLVDVAQVLAKRPAVGERLVSIFSDGLTPVPLVPAALSPGFGKVLFGNLDLTGDGKVDLVVSAPGANENGDGSGAVFVFAGGTLAPGPNLPALLIVGDASERGAFGQDLSVTPARGTTAAALGIGAPRSNRTGTTNGTAFVLPLDF